MIKYEGTVNPQFGTTIFETTIRASNTENRDWDSKQSYRRKIYIGCISHTEDQTIQHEHVNEGNAVNNSK